MPCKRTDIDVYITLPGPKKTRTLPLIAVINNMAYFSRGFRFQIFLVAFQLRLFLLFAKKRRGKQRERDLREPKCMFSRYCIVAFDTLNFHLGYFKDKQKFIQRIPDRLKSQN